jgi:serine/threonine protein kinase/nitrous oxidase accessory protein NosD
MVKPSERLGNYEVATSADGSALVLGSGAGGITYRGRHIHLGTEVAIKVLVRRKHLLQKDRDAFLSEARAAASLSHPQIARILDFGESAQQHPYYVMEICEGGSLEDLVRKSGKPDSYACTQWLFESASALAHAHRKGILHRDIKPSNLLVAVENLTATIKLIDFGLADHANPDETVDAVIGTPLFAAPEQLRGKAEAASDVFSLGATFLWLLSGRLLAEGDVWKVIDERLAASSYATSLESVPAIWQSLLGRMLEVDPARRLRDGGEVLSALQETFPNHPGQPVSWDASVEIHSPGPDATSQWTDHPAADWNGLWVVAGPSSATEHGVSFRATRADDGTIHDVSIFNNLANEVVPVLTTQGDLVARHAVPLGLDHLVLDRGDSWWSVAWPALGAVDALSWVRQGQTAGTAEILTALDAIASALDGIQAGGFEHLEIHPSMLIVSGGGADGVPLKFSLSVPLPVLAAGDQAADSAGTMRGATGAGLCARFAACVYQLLSGRSVPPAAFVNARAYQAIPKLTERSNRFLSSAIAGALGDGACRDVISGLAHEERITGAGRSGSSSLAGGATTLRSNPAVSIPLRSTPVVSPPPEVPLAPSPPAIPSPPVPAVNPGGRNWLIPMASAVVLILLLLGLAAWLIVPKLLRLAKPTPVQQPPTVVVKPETARVAEPPVVTPVVPPAKSSSTIKVPGDTSSIAEAVQRCQDGGTIEIAGGTYAEALVLTKSLTITSTPAAVFEDRGLGSNLIVARGPVQVTLRNIQIKNSEQQAKSAIDSSPALLLVTDGSKILIDGCVIESSVGDGVSLVDKASATFSNCRIRKNRGYGIHVSSGSKVDVSLSEIQQSGRSGIALTNVGTAAKLGNGTTVADNSRNGVEVANGATLECGGTTINGNQMVGLIVEGSGSVGRLESSCVISANRKHGIGVFNSGRLSMSDSTVEDNRESGLYAKSGGQVEIVSCHFKSNGAIGVSLVDEPTRVTIAKSDFSSHTSMATAFEDGLAKVTDCKFINNPAAIYYGKGAKGAATGNAIRPGPLENTLILQEAGEVSLGNNVIDSAR